MILGGSKMKLKNLIKIAPMFLLVFTLSVQAWGDEHIKRISISPIEPATLTLDWPVSRITVKSDGINIIMPWTDCTIEEMESWMFNEEYLASEEPLSEVEGWMLEAGYLEAESQPVEGWMADASYLGQPSTDAIESWMLNEEYLAN
jgi:hypothetical protein